MFWYELSAVLEHKHGKKKNELRFFEAQDDASASKKAKVLLNDLASSFDHSHASVTEKTLRRVQIVWEQFRKTRMVRAVRRIHEVSL